LSLSVIDAKERNVGQGIEPEAIKADTVSIDAFSNLD
jgi:hypothetical protein